MLTIGEFAQATGLTAKALRLYDDLDLLRPATVDARNGYRYYKPQQVDAARLVARLRSAGVPLVRIAAIVGAQTPEVGAAELLSYWRQVEADIASARTIVASLAAQMKGPDTTMDSTQISIRSAYRAGQGARAAQLDGLYPKERLRAAQLTGQRLFVVADGFGDDDGVAAAAIDALAILDDVDPSRDPLAALDSAVTTANKAVANRVGDTGGTTLTALLLLPDRALVAHVGDSRAYLVRHGNLERLTRDHTIVQSLVDQGRLTQDEAYADPDRALLNRALSRAAPSAPDLLVRATEPGDRFVLATDGVHAVLDVRQLAQLLCAADEPEAVTAAVEEAVRQGGAPDNYALVVIDI